MQPQSDTQIRASLRMVMARHGIDPNQTSFICTKGIVRLQGELRHHGSRAGNEVKGEEVEALEKDIRHVRGVVRVHFDIRDWRKDEGGSWSRTRCFAGGFTRASKSALVPGSAASAAYDY